MKLKADIIFPTLKINVFNLNHETRQISLVNHVFLMLLKFPLLFLEMKTRHETIFQIYAAKLIKLGYERSGNPFPTSH